MNNIVNYIEKLTSNDDFFIAAKDALEVIYDEFNISCVEIKDKDNKKLVLLNNSNDKKVYHLKKTDFIEIKVYKKGNEAWNISQLELLDSYLSILVIRYETIISMKKIEESYLIHPETELPNSIGYMELIKKIDDSNLNKYTALYININNYAIITKNFDKNDAIKILKSFSNSLKEFKNDDEIFAYFGGNNFAGIIHKERFAEFLNLVNNFNITLHSNNKETNILLSCCLGAYEIDKKLADRSNIINWPALAYTHAKKDKKNFVFLTDDLLYNIIESRQIELTFEDELKKGHIIPYYQPKVDIRTGKIVGSEALARWIKGDKVLSPAIFIPTLEAANKIYKLDLYILECICKDINFCKESGLNTVPVSCNFSRKDLETEDIDKKIINIINKYHIEPNEIIIEVTETTTIEEQENMHEFLKKMSNKGISTSIDDFGTGYSSLAAIRDYKVNEIKIDRSFINRDSLMATDEIIISSIIEMARKLNIEVICEGVETELQASFLERLGCYNAQGFLYDKPLTSKDYQKKLFEGKYNI